MKCLLVSDLHYALEQFDWVHRAAEDFDIVVIAGDHLDISSSVSIEAQIVVILRYLRRVHLKAKLLVCSGNHDLNGANAAGEKTARWMSRVRALGIAVDGDAVVAEDGTLYTICPWWDGPKTRDIVAEQLAADAARTKSRWVWIYHFPPANSPTCFAGMGYIGDADLSAWIEQYRPDMVLAGHIHQSPFKDKGSWVDKIGDTWVFNSGREMGAIPTHVVIDTDAQRADWYSSAGAERVELDQPLVRPVAKLA